MHARSLCLSSLTAGLDEGRKDVFRLLAKLARDAGVCIYLVGGPVRDALLQSPNSPPIPNPSFDKLRSGALCNDLDFSVAGGNFRSGESGGVAIAKRFAAETGGKVTMHPQFGTATVVTEKCKVDLVTARREDYPEPGSLPRVTAGSIEDDLARRDFTINAMALRVWPEGEGILDPMGGLDDLQAGIVRVLHSQSFVDDPTRMFRAVRYEQRFGFRIDDGTLQLMAETVESGHMESVSGERWRHEIERMLEEDDPGRPLLRSAQLGLLAGIHPALSNSDGITGLARIAQGTPSRDEWLAALFSPLSAAEGCAVIRRLRLPNSKSRRWAMVARDTIDLREKEAAVRESAGRPSDLYRILSPLSPQAIAARAKLSDDPVARLALLKYLNELRFIRPRLTGEDLLEMGAPQGPLVGEILVRLHCARLDGALPDIGEERALARELLTRSREGAAI